MVSIHAREAATAINRLVHANIEHVHDVGIHRIGKHMIEIPRTLAEFCVGVDALPRSTSIDALEESAVLVLDHCPHKIALRT